MKLSLFHSFLIEAVLLFVFALTTSLYANDPYISFDLYKQFPSANGDSSHTYLKDVGPNQDIYVKIYAHGVINLTIWKMEISFDTTKLKWEKIRTSYGYLANNDSTGEKNILNQNSNVSLTFNPSPSTFYAETSLIKCGALLLVNGRYPSDEIAPDGSGLMCILHFSTAASFTTSDTATIQPTLIEFYDNRVILKEPSINNVGKINHDDQTIPVELNGFSGQYDNDMVNLFWNTASETNNLGFEIERSRDKTNFEKVIFKEGYGTTTQEHAYSYTDRGLESGTYFYRLKQIDFDGASSYSEVLQVTISQPIVVRLFQNYPNPFNPRTTIRFSLKVISFLELTVFNAAGQEVAQLINNYVPAGYHSFEFDGSQLSSGIYFYRLKANNFIENKKMTLLK